MEEPQKDLQQRSALRFGGKKGKKGNKVHFGGEAAKEEGGGDKEEGNAAHQSVVAGEDLPQETVVDLNRRQELCLRFGLVKEKHTYATTFHVLQKEKGEKEEKVREEEEETELRPHVGPLVTALTVQRLPEPEKEAAEGTPSGREAVSFRVFILPQRHGPFEEHFQIRRRRRRGGGGNSKEEEEVVLRVTVTAKVFRRDEGTPLLKRHVACVARAEHEEDSDASDVPS
ncbi:hypothetical protein QOT17_007888 [Balamuthia mandrillaris]